MTGINDTVLSFYVICDFLECKNANRCEHYKDTDIKVSEQHGGSIAFSCDFYEEKESGD